MNEICLQPAINSSSSSSSSSCYSLIFDMRWPCVSDRMLKDLALWKLVLSKKAGLSPTGKRDHNKNFWLKDFVLICSVCIIFSVELFCASSGQRVCVVENSMKCHRWFPWPPWSCSSGAESMNRLCLAVCVTQMNKYPFVIVVCCQSLCLSWSKLSFEIEYNLKGALGNNSWSQGLVTISSTCWGLVPRRLVPLEPKC